MKKSVRIITAFFVFAASVTYAQDSTQTRKQWTLEECIQYALTHSLDIRRSELSMESANIDRDASKYNLFPTLDANSSYGSLFGRSIDPTTNLFSAQQINSYNVSGSSSVLLWNANRLKNTLKENNQLYEASEKDLEKARNDVSINVASYYLQVLLNKEQQVNAEKQLASTNEQLQRTQKLEAAGSVPHSDVLNLEAQSASNELTLTQAQNAVSLSLLQLQQYMLLAASPDFDVQTPELNVEEDAAQSVDSPQAIYEDALAAMPEVKAANLRLEGSVLGVKASRGGLFPRLTLNGAVYSNYSSAADRQRFVADGGDPTIVPVAIGYVQGSKTPVLQDTELPSGTLVNGYPIGNQLKDNISESLNIGLSIPIFNGLSSRLNVQRATIAHERAQADVSQVNMQLRQSIESAYNDALAASKTYQSAKKQEAARDEAFRMTQERYQIGAANFVEFQVAQNELFQAQSDLVRAKYDLIFKKQILDFYQGKPIKL